MVSLEIKPQQNGSASTSGVSAVDKTPLIAPSQSQRPQRADSAETAREYIERKIRELEEKDRGFGEDQKRIMANKEAKQKKRLADAGPSKGPRKLDKTQWDGFITDQPPFPPSELIALKPCSFSADFYAYARRNGRTGVIKTDLIEDILKNSPRMPLDDAAMMSAIQPEPEDTKFESGVEGKKSKDKQKSSERKNPRATTTQGAAADNDSATEAEITSQTFEQVCEELKTYMQKMDTRFSTESEMQQTRFCLDTINTVTERVKGLGNRSLAQHHMMAAASSSPSAPSATDPKINRREPKKNPPFPMIEAKSLSKFDLTQALLFPTILF